MAKETNKRLDKLAVNVSLIAMARMADMLSAPKKLDELKRLPAYVKDGVVYDFEDREFWGTNSADGEIFSVEKVLKTQAVTSALKRDYTQALHKWIAGDTEPTKPAKEEKTKEDKPETDGTVDLVGDVKTLLDDGKLKKANKLIKDNPDHPKFKKAKKLYKKAVKAKESE